MNDILKCKNIIICSGAGVSVSSGIPDYRSVQGIFSTLSPEKFFTRSYVQEHPSIYKCTKYKTFIANILSAKYSPSHTLATYLHNKGILAHVITQNIDGLYQKAGLPDNKIIEFHGSLFKENVLLYGDHIAYDLTRKIQSICLTCDCMLVMGTSLQTSPFCAIPNLVSKSAIRILVDIHPENCLSNPWSNKNPHLCTWVKYGKRKVTLKPKWNVSHSRWGKQYLFEVDCDLFSTELMKISI